jgi:hypothetical protein
LKKKEIFKDKYYKQMKKNCLSLDPITAYSTNLGNQNLILNEKIKKFLEVNDLSKWKEEYQGEVIEIFISVKISVNYSLANDFILLNLNKIVREYLVFYFKYFLIAMTRIKRKLKKKESTADLDNISLKVTRKSVGVFEKSDQDIFKISHLLEIILDFLDLFNKNQKEIFEGKQRTAKAILITQFLKYCIINKAKQLFFMRLKPRNEIIYFIHQNSNFILFNEIDELSNFPYKGRSAFEP